MTIFRAQGKLRWTQAFIGLRYRDLGRDFDGVDCYGVLFLVYAERAGIQLPRYEGDYLSADERQEVDALIRDQARPPVWTLITDDVDARNVQELDLAVFRVGDLDSHVGVIVAPGEMLHMVGEDCVKLQSYRDGRWAGRLTGIYRHAALLDGTAVRA